MRNVILAALGGLVGGHILWLVAISLAMDTARVSTWVLIIAAVTVVAAGVSGWLGWRSYQRRSQVWAAFLWCLPVSPVLFTLAVLGVTYL